MNYIARASLAALLASTAALPAVAGDQIREIVIFSRPQAGQQAEFQSVQLIAQEWRKLGLDVKVEVMPWEQMSNVVWYDRGAWDATAWQMVGRPERSDPDELLFNLFHSTTAESGYNFIGYTNPEYDSIVEAQRREVDQDKRREMVFEAQDILSADQPNMMLVHPKSTFAFNKAVFDPETVVNQSGIGIKNAWTFMDIAPLGDEKDIVLNSSDNVKSINPLYISGGVDSWLTELVYDRLLRVGPDGLPQPWAAESYEWLDDATIALTLRPDMMWHDGEPVTAEDVKFSYEAAASEEAPMYQPFAKNIDSVDVEGDVVTFHLKTPLASFLTSTLAKINIIPEHVWGPILADLKDKPENAESYQEDTPIGSGPYKFASWTKNEEIVLEANTDHFHAPKADRWILRIVPNAEAALGMLKSGELNFIGEFPGDPQVLVDAATENPDLAAVSTVDIGFRYIGFNNRRAPFDDPAFRVALSQAVNRQLIAKAAYRGYAVPSNSVVSPALEFWHDPSVEDFATGTDLAKQTLEDAGYTLEGGKLHYPGDIKETLGN